MATNVVMPKLSDTMEDGKILRWLKKKGDDVAAGDVLAEVETDKADMELEAEADGVLSEILVQEGSSAAVGDVIAKLGEGKGADADGDGKRPSRGEGARPGAEDAEAAQKAEPAEAAESDETADEEPAVGARKRDGGDEERSRPKAEKAKAREKPKPGTATPTRKADGGKSGAEREDKPASTPGAGPMRGVRPLAKRVSPEAERIAREMGIDLSTIRGSGPGGRIVRRDLERLGEGVAQEARAPKEPADRPAASRREELTKIRKTVGRRMAESKREAPHFYMTIEIGMDECARLKDALTIARPDAKVSYTHLLVRAVAIALEEHPRINARYVPDDAVEFSEAIHVGIAVALEQGLIVPVLHDCQDKDIFEIAAEAGSLVERVRAGKPEGKDLSGGTFTISNLGMFPIEEFSAVINPPQAAVLAVGATKERPVARDGRIIVEKTMKVTLSSDHRVIDGAEAARFLETLKATLELPARLLL